MSFFSGFFASSKPSASPPEPADPRRTHHKRTSVQRASLGGSGRRESRRQDEELYGAPSPRMPSPTSPYNDGVSPAFANIPLADSSYPPPQLHRNSANFASRFKPFFSETLAAPLGMGRGEPIPVPSFASAAPPLRHTWLRISSALAGVPELPQTLSSPATSTAVSRLERVLLGKDERLRLPKSVKEHFLCHDGQDPFASHSATVFGGGQGAGLVFGLWVMSLEDVEAEWGFWRRLDNGTMPGDAFTASDFRSYSSRHRKGEPLPIAEEDEGAEDEKGSLAELKRRKGANRIAPWLGGAEMGSCPAGWVREVYSHPGWIPLLSDRAGNYIGIDLDPPPYRPPSGDSQVAGVGGGQGASRPVAGQVIAFGREIDEKVVLWRGEGEQGWGRWLASFAEDLEEGDFGEIDGLSSQKHGRHRRTRPGSEGGGAGWFNGRSEADEESSEDTDGEDGLGDVGYFNDGSAVGYGEHGGKRVSRGWRLKAPYKGMGVIQALCERSRKRWAEVGLRSSWRAPSPQPAAYVAPEASPRSPKLDSSELDPTPQLVASPPAIESETDPLAAKVLPPADPADPPATPGTPVAFVTPPSPAKQAVNLPSRGPQDLRRLSGEAARRPSGGSVPKPRRLPSGEGRQAQRRSHKPPPPPTGLGLPTMDDLLRERTPGNSVHDDEAWTPPSTAGRGPLMINGHGVEYHDLQSGEGSPTSPRLGNGGSFTRLPLVGRLSSEGIRGSSGGVGTVLPTTREIDESVVDQSPIQVVSTTEGATVPSSPPRKFSSRPGSPLSGLGLGSGGRRTPTTPPRAASRSGSVSPQLGSRDDGGWTSPSLGAAATLATQASTSTSSLEEDFQDARIEAGGSPRIGGKEGM